MNELLIEFDRLKEQVALAEINITRFVNGGIGSKVSSTRARKNLLSIKNSAQAMRSMISKIKNETTYKTED